MNVHELPEAVNKDTFNILRATPNSTISLVVEPRVTFFGKGWSAGFRHTTEPSPSGRPYIGYSGLYYRPVVARAQELLVGAMVTASSWTTLPWSSLSYQDFVYLDPPYVGSGDVGYGEIDHGLLLDVLVGSSFRWVLSGYDSTLYRERLGPPDAVRVRATGMCASGKGHNQTGEKRTECVWIHLP